MQFEPHSRMLKRAEVMNLTGLTGWQASTLIHRYGVQIGCQYVISAQRLKGLIADGTVKEIAQKHGGRPPKKEG